MGVGIAASFRILGGCRDVAAGLEFECLSRKRTTGRYELSFARFEPDGFNAGHLCRILPWRFTIFSVFVALGRLAYVPHQCFVRIASAFVGELGFPLLGVAVACQYLYLYFSEWFLGRGCRHGIYRRGFGQFVGLGGCIRYGGIMENRFSCFLLNRLGGGIFERYFNSYFHRAQAAMDLYFR